MPSISLPLDPAGRPIVSIGVYLSLPRASAMKADGLPLPKPFLGSGLIDTGASGTAIDASVVAALGLVATGSTPVHTPKTGSIPKICNCYDVSFWFMSQAASASQPSDVHLIHPSHITLPVMEATLLNQGFHALIGRDILAHCHMSYDGRAKSFILTFDPS